VKQLVKGWWMLTRVWLCVPEKHAHSGFGDLTLNGLPRSDDDEQLTLGQRHRRQLQRRGRSAADQWRRWADQALRPAYARQPSQQADDGSKHWQRTTTNFATCWRRRVNRSTQRRRCCCCCCCCHEHNKLWLRQLTVSILFSHRRNAVSWLQVTVGPP